MASDDAPDWLVRIHEEHGAALHRLVVLLGAEEESGRIVRSALLALHRRGHRMIDPAERVEFLQEHAVHLARAVREPQAPLALPPVDDARQQQVLQVVSSLPPRASEILVVSHYLAVFGPELAGIMRLSVRGCNQRLEIALETLRARLGSGKERPLEALSQELTAALRAAARTVQAPGTDTLAAELAEVGDTQGRRIGSRLATLLLLAAVVLGLLLAALTRPAVTPAEPDHSASARPTAEAPLSIAAVLQDVPVYYVGRADGRLFRELRDLPATGSMSEAALGALLNVAPLDPEYESAWSPGQVLSVEVDGDAVTVDLPANAYAEILTPLRALSARRQMVYTLAELLGIPDPRVFFLADGGPPPPEFRTGEGFGREGSTPLPQLWITDPQNLDQVAAGPILITGVVKPGLGDLTITVTDTAAGTQQRIAPQVSESVNADGWRVWTARAELTPGTYDVKATVQLIEPVGVVTENKVVEVS